MPDGVGDETASVNRDPVDVCNEIRAQADHHLFGRCHHFPRHLATKTYVVSGRVSTNLVRDATRHLQDGMVDHVSPRHLPVEGHRGVHHRLAGEVRLNAVAGTRATGLCKVVVGGC